MADGALGGALGVPMPADGEVAIGRRDFSGSKSEVSEDRADMESLEAWCGRSDSEEEGTSEIDRHAAPTMAERAGVEEVVRAFWGFPEGIAVWGIEHWFQKASDTLTGFPLLRESEGQIGEGAGSDGDKPAIFQGREHAILVRFRHAAIAEHQELRMLVQVCGIRFAVPEDGRIAAAWGIKEEFVHDRPQSVGALAQFRGILLMVFQQL